MTFGDRLKMVRQESTREELAQRIGVHKNTIARWERGEQYPDAHEIEVILKAYPHVDPGWFVTGEGALMRCDARHELGKQIKESQATYATAQYDAELQEIVRILSSDLPEAKPFILKVLHGQLEVKEGLEALRLGRFLDKEGKK